MASPSRTRSRRFACSLLLSVVGLIVSQWAVAASLTEVTGFGTNPGNLRMFEFVPADLQPNAALVVVAHGCLQTAQEIADISGWTDVASASGFAVVFPQTSRENDSFAGCFRTWLPEHQQRDQGEPLSVLEMVKTAIARHGLDPKRVFITGMSSGGHLTNVMLATYPDLFSAGAPQSSFPYKCALSFADVEPCCRGAITHTAKEWGDLARSGHPGYQGVRPRVSIWHGYEDPLLKVENLGYQRQQWLDTLAIDDQADSFREADGYTGIEYRDAAGVVRVETFTIPRLGHAVALDLRETSAKCGRADAYAADVHFCASLWIARWFGVAQ